MPVQDVDNLIDLLVDPWHTVRANWEDHARFLFHEYTGVHRVLQEATFANDEGIFIHCSVLLSYTIIGPRLRCVYDIFCLGNCEVVFIVFAILKF